MQYLGYEIFIDENTGELMTRDLSTGEESAAIYAEMPAGSTIITPAEKRARKKFAQRYAKYEMLNAIRAIQKDALGHFYFANACTYYDDISATSLARLCYLCTYLQFGKEMLYLTKRKLMQKNDLPKILNLSRNTVDSFLTDAHRYLRITDDGNLCVDTGVFFKGTLRNKSHVSYQRIYLDGFKALYHSTPASKHRYIGYLLKMLPYINVEHNILCENPEEKNLCKLEVRRYSDFCHEIGYSIDHASRLRDEYSRLTVNVNGQAEKLCSFVLDGNKNPNDSLVVLNPHVIYSGSNHERVKSFASF